MFVTGFVRCNFYFRTTVLGFAIDKVNNRRQDRRTSVHAGFAINAGLLRQIGQLLGVDLPVIPDAHEAGVTDQVERFFNPMVVDIEPSADSENYYFYQAKDGAVLFCITPKPKRIGETSASTSEFLPMVVPRLLRIYPRLGHLRVRRVWRGMYPGTPDDRPIVGFDREVEGMFHAVGMCGQGLMLGPGLGELIADYVTGSLQPEDESVFEQLSPYRDFSGQELLR